MNCRIDASYWYGDTLTMAYFTLSLPRRRPVFANAPFAEMARLTIKNRMLEEIHSSNDPVLRCDALSSSTNSKACRCTMTFAHIPLIKSE